MEIKPCPFCGATAYLQEAIETLWIECSGCLTSGPLYFVSDSTPEDCINEWNRVSDIVSKYNKENNNG